MPVLVPTFSDPFFTQTTVLDGTAYKLAFKYAQREDAWYLTIGLTDGTVLVSGVKLVSNRPLLSRFTDVRLPRGVLMCLAREGDAAPPGLLELGDGKRVRLIYYPVSDFA